MSQHTARRDDLSQLWRDGLELVIVGILEVVSVSSGSPGTLAGGVGRY